MSTVTLEVTPEMAAWYVQASEAEKREMALMLEMYYRELTNPKPGDSLLESMRRISAYAKEQGMTEEILAEILADE
jgi:hypothetical protein